METLVRLNEAAKVPSEKMERWYKKHVVKASASVRRQSVSLLSLHPSSRRFLLDGLQKNSDTHEICEYVAQNLRHRASSTLKMERFEFMSKKDCQEIMVATEGVLEQLNKKG